MKRDPRCSIYYWDKWIIFSENSLSKDWVKIQYPSGNPDYRPQFIFEMVKYYYEIIFMKYSRGDVIDQIEDNFDRMLDAWELSEKLGKDVWSKEIQYTRHAWEVNLDYYVMCFWLTGLALTLEIDEVQWQRLLKLMGNEGEDALLDRVIASRQPGRKIGKKLCFPKAYTRLKSVMDAEEAHRPALLREYLDHWLPDLENAGSKSFPKDFRTPYWWDVCNDETQGLKGAYFGCWCIEAVAVAKAFGIDDTVCLEHTYYPGDLLQDGRSPRYPDIPSPYEPAREEGSGKDAKKKGFFSRLFHKN